ncbi:MAG TPA: helix-turn-helix domain-containing protein [Blastocatellia bacterium]|nr:helix-turn-helix domain-containing protein [Blastocatellia bacterium]
MNTSAIKRFLTVLSSTVKLERGQLYQLVQSAEASYCLRDIESQREIGLLLQSFGYPFNQVGKYYESIYLYRSGEYQKATELLENVADSAPAQYRSKALLSLSAVEERIGHFEESLWLRLRVRTSLRDDPLISLETQQSIAVLRSLEGDHGTALRDLERLLPLAHIIGKRGHPAYFTFLNSYALELSETGRTEAAEQVANVIAASPFISKYPEWQETVSEIASRSKRSSFIAVTVPHHYELRHPRIRIVVEFMKANLQRAIHLPELADVANLSRSYFSRVFKAQTGFSPGDYLIQLRLEKARELLRNRSLSVKEVMVLVGFNTKSNFAQQFKKRFRFPPSEYRKRTFR